MIKKSLWGAMNRSLSKGFLMVELGVAIVLLMIFFFLISSWYARASGNYAVGGAKLKALSAATVFLERVRAHPKELKSQPRKVGDVFLIVKIIPTDLSCFVRIHIKARCGDQMIKLKTGMIL